MLFAYNSEICIILSVIDNNYYNFKILMNPNISAIQYMGMIMRLDQLNIDYVLSLV